MVFIYACLIMRQTIVHAFGGQLVGRCRLSEQVRKTVFDLRFSRRSCRVGQHVQAWRQRLCLAEAVTCCSVSNYGDILVVIGNRPAPVSVSESSVNNNRNHCIHPVQREPICHPLHIGLFSAPSVANKSAAVKTWISDSKLNIAVITDNPQLVACARTRQLSTCQTGETATRCRWTKYVYEPCRHLSTCGQISARMPCCVTHIDIVWSCLCLCTSIWFQRISHLHLPTWIVSTDELIFQWLRADLFTSRL